MSPTDEPRRAPADRLVRTVTQRLEGDFGRLLPLAVIDRAVRDARDELAARSRIRAAVPRLVERSARSRLEVLARDADADPTSEPAPAREPATTPAREPAPARLATHASFDADLDELEGRIDRLAAGVGEMARRLARNLRAPDADELGSLVGEDDEVDRANQEIATRATEIIALRQPVASDLRRILAMLETSLHLERTADCLVDSAALLRSELPSMPGGVDAQLVLMAELVAAMTEGAVRALVERDRAAAEHIETLDEVLDQRHRLVFDQLVDDPTPGSGDEARSRRDLLTIDRISRLLERAGDHAVDIAEQAIFFVSGDRVELGRTPADHAIDAG